MATTYTVTNTFIADTNAIAGEVNQNNTDLLTALNSFDAGNLGSGTVPLARISGLTATQLAAAAFKDEDDMASDSATAVSSQQAIKAHVTASRTDGYTPTTYAGEESVTFPNGMILKQGYKAGIGAQSITFAAAFSTVKFGQITMLYNSNGDTVPARIKSLTASGMSVYNGNTGTGFYWQAWGY